MMAYFLAAVILVIGILFPSEVMVSTLKPYRLTIFSLIGKTGSFPKDGKTCQEVQTMVADEVNARDDVLPNFQVVIDFADEGPASMFAGRMAVDYTRRMEALRTEQPDNYQSPIIIGTAFTPGCKSFGSFVQHLDSVAIVTACLSPIYTANRRIYPNMYRSRITAELNNFGLLSLIKQVGNWNKVAVYANADNSYNTLLAVDFISNAMKANVSVIWFDVASGIPQSVIQSMKSSGARIIVVQIVEVPVFLNFLCLANKFGMRSSRYVFMASHAITIDPFTLPPIASEGCTREMIIQQFQAVFLIGTTNTAFENNGETTLLRYDMLSFNKQFMAYTKNPKAADMEDRYGCHDIISQAILALDTAERRLAQRNLSLRDFGSNRHVVMKVVNESVADSDFIGLRTGRLKYSKRLENDDEPMYIASWRPSKGFQLNYRSVRLSNFSVNNPNGYILQPVSIPNWLTVNKLPPKDFHDTVIVIQDLSGQSQQAVLAIAGVFITIKLTKIVLLWKFRSGSSFYQVKNHQLLVAACIVATISSILFVIDPSDILCSARIFIAALGLSSLSGLISFRLVLLKQDMMSKRNWPVFIDPLKTYRNKEGMYAYIIKAFGKGSDVWSSQNPAPNNGMQIRRSTQSMDNQHPRHYKVHLTDGKEKTALIAAVLFSLANVAAVLVLLIVDPPKVRRVPSHSYMEYEDSTDTMTIKYMDVCNSKLQMPFLTSLVTLNMFILILGSFFAYELRSTKLRKEDICCRIAVVNAASLFAAFFCIVLIMQNPLSVQLAFAVGTILLSFSTAMFAVGWPLTARIMQ